MDVGRKSIERFILSGFCWHDFFFFFATLPSRPSVSCLQHDTNAQLVFSALEVCV